jgi:hypothetical protein
VASLALVAIVVRRRRSSVLRPVAANVSTGEPVFAPVTPQVTPPLKQTKPKNVPKKSKSQRKKRARR